MSFKLRRISKLNIVVAVVMCMTLCFMQYVVQAADDVKDYTGQRSVANAWWYNIVNQTGTVYRTSNNDVLDKIKSTDDSYVNPPTDIKTQKDWWADMMKNQSVIDVYGNLSYEDFKNQYDVITVFGLYADGGGYSRGWQEVFIVRKSIKYCLLPKWDHQDVGLYPIVFNNDGKKLSDVCRLKISSSYKASNFATDSSVLKSAALSEKNNSFFINTAFSNGDYNCNYLVYTNAPLVDSESDVDKYFNGDDSVVKNKMGHVPGGSDGKTNVSSESFYWDSMTCKPSSVGNSKYAFSFNYTYSCPLMTDPTEMFSCDVVYNSDIRYQDGKGRVHTYTDSKTDTFSLNKHKNGYVNNSLYLNSTLLDNTGSSAQHKLDELFDGIVGLFGHVDLDTRSDTEITVKSAKIYVTVLLYHVPDPDTLFSNSDIMQSAKENMIMSTDVRAFSFDLFNLKEDADGAVVKPTVTTEDVKDNDGNVVDKKVTDVVASDDSGKTVINITIDNSNKVTDGNANINTGGGSSDDDDEDKNSKSFWKYVTGIVAFFTALLNSDSGLFAVIASYFKFIPADFWSVTIGAIVVIAILSIYRLAKKGG